MLQVFGVNQCAFVDRVNDAAAAEKRIEADNTNRGGIAAVVERRVGMRAKVRRQRDRADIDRTPGADLRRPLLLISGIAGECRRRRIERRRDVVHATHEC